MKYRLKRISSYRKLREAVVVICCPMCTIRTVYSGTQVQCTVWQSSVGK